MDEQKKLTPLKAIKAHCFECCGYNQAEVKRCTAEKCPLWPYRLGKGTKKTELSEEQRAAIGKRLAEAKKKKAIEN